MSKISLQCRECKKEYESTFKYICDECFGPLDVKYDFSPVSKNAFDGREHTYWRYFELLPIQQKSNIVSIHAGMTPLIRAEKLGKELGLNNLYIKNDSVNPTFSFKDRPAGVAVSKAKEFGLSAVGCASTGNLASATAAHAAKGGFPCYVFAPSDIEHAKIAQALAYGSKFIAVDGTYDDANRIAAQIGDSKGIGIVNINMRSYYVEGSKTLAYEVAEQLGWQVPDQLIVPVGSGAMLNAICKGFEELQTVSLLNDVSRMRMIAAQPHGCAPVVDAFKRGDTEVIPVENPDTIAKSLAIGDPGDGRYVLKRLKQYNGYAEESNNKEILDAILLLAKTEGVFTEPAGGVSVAVLKKMVEDGKIDKNDTTVCYVTGNGLKATESIMEVLQKPQTMKADVAKISAVVQ
ncbi:threonine synthase [Candidatus Nitrosotenuis uzonensis]|uniref:Threonine synthase n=1 Tax=Candidatus Nitrosotenuis uzonensis TaxID=1407055 RepID=V6AU70_9ARCH|nr:threonine synthase [Candidatus Nitrosotenuis uzonensis]CDI06311.1 Threonine synthase [Candidatus Nitrosotenuis uzonensis]